VSSVISHSFSTELSMRIYFVRSSMIVYDVELIPLYQWNDAWKTPAIQW